MNLFDDWKIRIMFWGTYLLTILALWWHTYQIFLANDPPLIAGASAAAIDGMLALTLYVVGRSYGKTKDVAIGGTILFALLSAGAQIVSRNLTNPDVPWVRDIALYLLPVSGVLTLLVLGFIKYFDQNKDGVPDFMQGRSQKPKQQNQPSQNSQRFVPPPPQRPALLPVESDEMARWQREMQGKSGNSNGNSNGHNRTREFTAEHGRQPELDDPKA